MALPLKVVRRGTLGGTHPIHKYLFCDDWLRQLSQEQLERTGEQRHVLRVKATVVIAVHFVPESSQLFLQELGISLSMELFSIKR